MSDYGLRQDGSPKGPGFLGEIVDSQGNIMTEYSIGVEIDGEEVEIPSLVPGLSDDELTALKNQEMPDSVVEKAVEHARKQREQGLPVFKEAEKNPWEKDWGIPQVEQETPEVVETGVPKFDWGIESYIKEIPQKVKTAVNDYVFERVFEKLIGAESAGRHFGKDGDLLTSSAGAKGVTQVMPDTGRDPGYGVKPLADNTEAEYRRFGRDYLQAMLKHFKGDYRKAVAAYNAGPGSVEKAIARAESKGGDWTQYLPKKSETIPYMHGILGDEISPEGQASSFNRELYEKRDTYTLREEEGRVRGREVGEGVMSVMSDTPISEARFSNLKGFVFSDRADRIFINPDIADDITLLHEREHLSQQWADRNQDRKDKVLGAVGNLDSNIEGFIKEITSLKDNEEIKKVFRASNAFDNRRELLANYSAYFQANGIDPYSSPLFDELTAKVGKEKAEELIAAANSYTMLDIPTLGRVKYSPKNPIVRDFKNKDSSYAMAAYEYLKSIFENGEENQDGP